MKTAMGKPEKIFKLFCKYIAVMVVLLIIASSCALSSADDPVTFHGRVTDTSGSGLADVEVCVYYTRDTAYVKTDAKGKYSITVHSAGRINLLFRKEGFTSISKAFILLGGEKEKLDLMIKSSWEEVYINFEPREINFNNYGGYASVQVVANQNYEIESHATFIQCTPSSKRIFMECDSNFTSEERSGMVIIKAEYGHRDTLIVKQKAGPVLVFENYFEKISTTYILNTPKAIFSKPIDIISVESSISNLGYQLSEDKKTIYFKNTGNDLFGVNSIRLWVKADDNIPIEYLITLRRFIYIQPFDLRDRESSIFTADNHFLWIHTTGMSAENFELRQFTTSDFRERILIKLDGFVGMSYNPYNNYLYLIKPVFFQDRFITELHLYNANSGEFVQEIIVDFNSETVNSLQFCRNGLGVMFLGENMLFLDSKIGHEYGVFPGSDALYNSSHPDALIPSYVATSNDFNLFLLYGKNSSGSYNAYSVDPETKVIRELYSSTINNFVTNNSSPYAFYFSSNYNKIISQNIVTAALKTLNINKTGIQNLAVIESGNEMPNLYCSDNSLFLTGSNQSFSFNNPEQISFVNSSNDAKLLLINKNNNLYLFKSEIVTAISEQNN